MKTRAVVALFVLGMLSSRAALSADTPAPEQILSQLQSTDLAARRAGVQALLLALTPAPAAGAVKPPETVAAKSPDDFRPALPVLIGWLKKEEPTDIKRAAAVALEKLGTRSPEAVTALIATAGDVDPSVRSASVSALGLLASLTPPESPAFQTILHALDEPLPQLRITALEALHRQGATPAAAIPAVLGLIAKEKHPDAMYALTACLAAADPVPPEAAPYLVTLLRGRKNAWDVVYKIGAKAAPAVAPLLTSETMISRREAAAFFEKYPPEDAATITALVERLKDTDPTTRKYAAGAIGALGARAKSVLPILIELLKNPDANVRYSAALVLEAPGMANEECVPGLLAMMQENTLAVRTAAGKALAQLGPKAMSGLLDLLKSPRDEVRAAASIALASFGDALLPALTKQLASGDETVVPAALLTLDRIGGAKGDAVAPVIGLLSHTKATFRSNAMLALRHGAAQNYPQILAALQQGDKYAPEVQAVLTEALSHSGLAGLDEVAKCAANADGTPQILAIDALGKSGSAAAQWVPMLVSKLVLVPAPATPVTPVVAVKHVPPGAPVAPVQAPYARLDMAVLHTLDMIGKPAEAAVPMCFELLKDGDAGVRSAAARTLSRTSGTERIPPLSEIIERCDIGSLALALKPYEFSGVDALLSESAGASLLQRHRIALVFTNMSPMLAIPALARALRHDDPHIRASAAEALGEFCHAPKRTAKLISLNTTISPDILAALREATADPDPDVRVLAGWACASALDPKEGAVLARIASGLAGSAPEYRVRALVALEHFDLENVGREAAPAIPAILKLVSDNTVSQEARAVLERIGMKHDDVPALIEAVKEHNFYITKFALKTLAALGPQAKDAAGPLLDLAADQDKAGTRELTATLASIGEEAVPLLIEALKSNKPGRQLGAERALAQIKLDSEHLTTIAAMLNEDIPEVRGAALMVLSTSSERAQYALPHMGDLLAEEDRKVLRALPELMASLGSAASAGLIEALKDQRSRVRVRAALSLRPAANNAPNPEAFDPLVKMLADESPDVKTAALQALTIYPDEQGLVTAHLPEVMKDETSTLRRAALQFLKNHPNAPPVPACAAISLALKDITPTIRYYAIGALRSLGSQPTSAAAVSKLLFEALKDEDPKVHGEAAVTLEALDFIKTPKDRLAVNERMAFDALEAYGHAQEDFFVQTWDEHKIHYYASTFKELNLDKCAAAVRGTPKEASYFGYWFKPLDGQTARAPGGAKTYRVDDKLMHGHALMIYPERYGETGTTTWIVSDDGTIFAKDLGAKGTAEAATMTLLDPDAKWTKTKLKPHDEAPLRFHPQDQDVTPLEF